MIPDEIHTARLPKILYRIYPGASGFRSVPIIAMEQFLAVQEERKRRSNMVLDEFGEYHRAAQRYSMCKKQTGDLLCPISRMLSARA